jgi:hypothetical protein
VQPGAWAVPVWPQWIGGYSDLLPRRGIALHQ